VKRVVFLDHTAVLSGAELALCTLTAALDPERWRPEVILGQAGPLVERLEAIDVPVEVLPMSPVLLGDYGAARTLDLDRPLGSLAYALQLARLLRQKKADIVHCVSLRACVLGGLAARLAWLPNVWHVQCIVAPPMLSAGGSRILTQLARWLPNHVIFNSFATASMFDLAVARASVIPVGIDTKKFAPNGRVAGRPIRVGMIARIAPLKGQHVFVEAARELAAQHPDVEFVVAGSPLFGEEEYARKVRRLADGCERVRFLGFVDDVPALLDSLDVVVHASVLPEAFGQVLVEAMLAARPVVASALGGPLETVEDGVTGVLVPPGDAPALASAVDCLLSNPGRGAEMGMRGRERALASYGAQAYARDVQAVYDRMVSAA
jgi:glycosyltransferase involved in cell wall biosynthesis